MEASSDEAPEEEASPVAPPCRRISSRKRLWEEAAEEPRLRRRAWRSSRAETASVARLALEIKRFWRFFLKKNQTFATLESELKLVPHLTGSSDDTRAKRLGRHPETEKEPPLFSSSSVPAAVATSAGISEFARWDTSERRRTARTANWSPEESPGPKEVTITST